MRDVRTDELPGQFRGIFRTDELARAMYSEGAGIARTTPTAVAVPRDVEDASELVRWAKASGHSLIPRGSGSGMAAGAVGSHVVVDLSRFCTIEPVNVESRTIRAGTGALRNDIDAAARAVGLRFPVDPSSGAFCTIGGMTATNAAGARTLRFGSTRRWVQGVHCVFDDGSSAWVRRNEPLPGGVPALSRLEQAMQQMSRRIGVDVVHHSQVRKESSGYGIASALESGDLLDLLIGSEGTLALFTEVELCLISVPSTTATVLATFKSLDDASACAADVAYAGAAACEMLDRTYLQIAERSAPTGIDVSADAVLLIELEGDSTEETEVLLQAVKATCKRHGAAHVTAASDSDSQRALWRLRHAASPTLSQLPASQRSMQFIEDGCVPPRHFAEYVRGVRAALDRADVTGVIFGHAGDAHAHVNPLIDLTDSHWRDTVRQLMDDVSNLTARLGGTLAGEHGDGRLRAPLLQKMWSVEARAAFANIKSAADPADVFNPGCKIAREGDDPLLSIRYDPELLPLPPIARAALDNIERERAWNRFRLDYAS